MHSGYLCRMRKGMGNSLLNFDLTTGAYRRDPFVFRLWTFVVLGLVLIASASAYYVGWQHRKHVALASEANQQLIRTVQSQVGDQLTLLDRMLAVVGQAAVGAMPGDGSDVVLAEAMGERAQSIVTGLREVLLVDETGHPLNRSPSVRRMQTDALAAAPEVIAWFQQHADTERYLGHPQLGQVSKLSGVVVAHRLRTAQGKPVGAVLAVVDSDALLHVFAELRRGQTGQIHLLHGDALQRVASLPLEPQTFAEPQRLPGLDAEQMRREGSGTLIAECDETGRQLMAYQAIPGWPLIVVACKAETDVAVQMWENLQGYLGIMLSLALLMVVLSYGLYRAHGQSREATFLSQTVFDATPLGLAVFAGDGSCLAFNQALLKLLPEKLPDVLGRSYQELPGWEAAGVTHVIEACRSDGQMRSDLLSHPMPDGEVRWLRYSASAIRDRGREHVLLTVLDMSEPVRARNALAESERRYREFYESSQEGIVRTDASGRFVDANRAYLDMMGYTLTELRRLRVRDVTDPAELALERRRVREQADVRGYADEYEKSQRRKDGSVVELSIRLWRVRDDAGKNTGYWSVVRDVTAQKHQEAQRRLAAMVFDSSAEAILLTDGTAKILTANPAFERITGYTVEDVVGQTPHMLDSGMQDDSFYQSMWAGLKSDGAWEGEIWDRRKNGEVYLKWLRVNSIRDAADGPVTHYVGVFSDITERRKAEEQIQYLAHHDALTGLPNRYSLRAQLEQMLGRARRDGGGLALMFIDLDNFKTINDSLGHHYGDQLLVKVAARLREAIREGDVVARLGGDEFVVVMPGAAAQTDAIGVAGKIIEALRQPYEVTEQVLHSSPSIGISLFPADGDDIDTLMKNADSAMYHAKSQGRNNFQFYASHMNAAAAQRMALERALRKGLDAGQLLLHYQPQVDLRSGRVIGAEALVRWEDPVRGMIAPTEFIAVAERSGLIIRLGAWVMRRACLQLRQWQELGVGIPAVSINVSPLQFRHADFVSMVRQVLSDTGVDPACVDLEITESVLMESSDRSVGVLQDLRDLGVTFSIDDFGTGYSSLSYIKSFPAQRLKIDRSFVANIEHEANDSVIATAIIALAHSLGMQVVAEGAETAIQVDFLRDNECDFAQGYYFSRPLPAKDIEVWVSEL